MEPEGIRIKLNLSEFFNDKRKYSYIFIERNKIKDFYGLESRIRDEFAIRENIIFLIDNVFVPHSESIKLLHEEETLTLSADTIGLNYLRIKCSQNSETQYPRERKRKKNVCQAEDKRVENSQYFQPEDDIAFVTQRKKEKIPSLKGSNVSQNMPCSYSDTCAIKQDIEIDETCVLENEIMPKENEVYVCSRYKCEDTPTLSKKKDKKVKKRPIILEEIIIETKCGIKDLTQINSNTATDKKYIDYIKQGQVINRKLSGVIKENNIKKGKQKKKTEPQHEVNNVCPIETVEHSKEEMSFDDTKANENQLIVQLNSETNLNEGRKMQELSENCEYINNRETSISDNGCNPMMNIVLNNVETISTDVGNIDNCSPGRKRRRIRTRRRKKNDQLSASESQNISGPCAELNMLSRSLPEANHIRFSGEVSDEYVTDTSVKRNLNEINEDVKQNSVPMNSGDNDLNETVNSTRLSTDTSQIPRKSIVFLSRTTTPTPVDTFHKLLSLRKHSSTPFVFNRTSCNSNTFPENKHEKQPITIDYENDESMIVEKYPLINSTPKKGDTLAFKLFRMASDYTPHITSYIIATILQYRADTCQITVKVQRGLHELQEPQGRFSLFEDIEESCNQKDTYEFNWNELMETRLLFP